MTSKEGSVETTSNRLSQIASVIDEIDRRRAETGDPFFGARMEAFLIALALRDLEVDILADPGALQPQLSCTPDNKLIINALHRSYGGD
jgi:hypothetical protein